MRKVRSVASAQEERATSGVSGIETRRSQSERSVIVLEIANNRLSTRWLPLLIVALLAGALLLVACSGDDEQQQTAARQDQQQAQPAPTATAEDQQQTEQQQAAVAAAPTQQQQQETRDQLSALEGEIQVDGSSTVFPITEAMAEEFGILTERGVRVTVGVSGTGGGFKRFCAGETDISDASRPIKDSEVELCTEAGIDFIEVPVAFDGLTVVINPDNDWVDQLTVAELNHIFRPDDYATSWADVRDGFPDTEISLYAPGADSGTFDYFTEAINGDGGVHRSDNTTFSEDDNVLVQGVASDRGGIGYFGFSYYANNVDALKAVPVVNDAGEAITPSNETINDGSYNPLSRPLFIYVSVASLEREEVAAFVEYFLTDGTWLVDTPEVGYVQLPADIYAAALERVQGRVSGSAMAAAEEGASLGQIFGVEDSQSMVADLSALEGEIAVDGSSTVFPITEAMAEEFGILTERGVRVTVGVSGTGGGFKRFCAGETDISDASRPIKDSEVELCTEAGIDFIEVPVAFDGLTVVINPDNDWVDQLTVAELNHIFRPDDYATSWADVRDGFPDLEISLYAPGADSGTFDYFTEAINGDGGVHRSDNTTFSEDDNVLVQGVASDRGGIGYFGFSYYANNADALKAVPVINDAGEAITPSNGTINDGSYNPLSRPLFIYVSVASLEREEVAAFVEYFLTDGTWLVDTPEVGYVQLPEEIYAAALDRVQNGVVGSAMAQANGDAALAAIYGAE